MSVSSIREGRSYRDAPAQDCFAFIVGFVLLSGLGADALAQNCPPGQSGSAQCPVYVAPATTAVPKPSMDGSTVITCGVATTLFNGAVPPNGFMVQAAGTFLS